MTAQEFNHALKGEDRIYGTLLVSNSSFWPKVIGDCGLDFVFIDTEHIAINRETLSWMCRTYTALGLPPLVRITDPDPDKATMALDDGAAGIVAPYVEEVEQASRLVGATKYRPLKGRSLTRALAGESLSPELASYIKTNCAGNSLVINIESVPAMENLDSILEVPGVDAVLIGPHDLSTSLGVPEHYGDPTFLKAVETIFIKARTAGIGAGIHFWGSHDEHVRLLNMGANLFIHKADIILFRQHLKSELSAIREAVGDTRSGTGPTAGEKDVSI